METYTGIIRGVETGGMPTTVKFARKDRDAVIEQSSLYTLIEQSQHIKKLCSKLLGVG